MLKNGFVLKSLQRYYLAKIEYFNSVFKHSITYIRTILYDARTIL